MNKSKKNTAKDNGSDILSSKKINTHTINPNTNQNTTKDSLTYQNSLKCKMINLEGSINEVSSELSIHKEDVKNLKQEKEQIVNSLIEAKNQVKNEFFKEVKKINDEMEFVIKEQRNHISSLEERIKLLNSEKDNLCDYIVKLTDRIIDLEKQVGVNN